MVKPPTFDSNGMKKGAWNEEEDDRLRSFVNEFGHTNWRLLPVLAGLARCGKSCRLRWVNYLKPGLKRGKFTKHEEELIIKLHDQLGNRWSAIAVKMPGRTDNEIKNYWHAHINKRGRRRPPTPLPQEQVSPSPSSSSSENEFSSTHHQQEYSTQETPINTLDPIADLYSFAPAAHQGILSAADVDLPPFPVEDFDDFQLFQQMPSFCSSTSGEFIGDFWSESFGEDVLDILELW